MLHLARYSSITPSDFERALGITVGFDSMFDRFSEMLKDRNLQPDIHLIISAKTKKIFIPSKWLLPDFQKKIWKQNSKKVF